MQRAVIYFPMLLALAASIAGAASINTKSTPNGQTLFPEQKFDLQCWQEGNKIVDEKSLNTLTVGPELNDMLLSFRQARQGDKDEGQVILVTIGRALCIAKTR